jgi:transposase
VHAVDPGDQGLADAPAQLVPISFGAWLKTASERLHRNKLAVALANKLARIA